MKFTRLLLIGFITVFAAIAWFILGKALSYRTQTASYTLDSQVAANLGNPLAQQHPNFTYISPTKAQPVTPVKAARSLVKVNIQYQEQKKGLLRYRSYIADFQSSYTIENPSPINQTIYFNFQLPSENSRYDRFQLTPDGAPSQRLPTKGKISESKTLAPGEAATLTLSYRSRGRDQWKYAFGDSSSLNDFALEMNVDFKEINFPFGTESPLQREENEKGWNIKWDYADVIGLQSIGMDMPDVKNPGPIAARITFFAPVSLVFYFSVLVIIGLVRKTNLHPMNYFFLAAGCFAFQLLFAYLVDLIPITGAFAISATISLILVSGYVWLVAGKSLAKISAISQFSYMILFSYSFFFKGLTGITITIGAIITLALLMISTAKIDWNQTFTKKAKPPIIPTSPTQS